MSDIDDDEMIQAGMAHVARRLLDATTEIESLRARLAAAESRLREYEDAPVVAIARRFATEQGEAVAVQPLNLAIPDGTELIIRPRGGKGE